MIFKVPSDPNRCMILGEETEELNYSFAVSVKTNLPTLQVKGGGK